MGCSADDGDPMPEKISFRVEDSMRVNSYMTRGSQVNSWRDLGAFKASAQLYSTSGSYLSQSLGGFFFNLSCYDMTGTGYNWPDKGQYMSFYVYHPASATGLSVSSKGTTGRPTYTYTVPESVSSQVDFMTAEALDVSTTTRGSVSISFKHRMADLRFSVYNQASSSITVKSITVSGVKYSGSFTTSWSLSGSANTNSSHPFTLTSSKSVASKATVDYTGTNHFFMLPQTVSSGTTFLTVSITDENGQNKTLSWVPQSNLTLTQGKETTFTLTIGNDNLSVDASTDINDWVAE